MTKDKILNIELNKGNENILRCSYVSIDPCSYTTARRFVFHDITKAEPKNIEVGDKLTVFVNCVTKDVEIGYVYEFGLLVLDYDLLDTQWVLTALVYDDYEVEYRQGVVDVLNIWQIGASVNWSSLPDKSIKKSDYLTACLRYSGLGNIIRKVPVYYLDVAFIKEEDDFLYLIAVQLVGERGYCGWSFHTFKDCMSQFNENGQFEGNKTIEFLNSEKPYNNDIATLVREAEDVFLRYGFFVVKK